MCNTTISLKAFFVYFQLPAKTIIYFQELVDFKAKDLHYMIKIYNQFLEN